MRRDDGVGPVLAERLMEKAIPGVEVKISHQLQIENAEDFRGRRAVLLIDASDGGPEVDFRPVGESGPGPLSASTHHVGPALLKSICERLYGESPRLFLCTVRGEDFSIGTGFTDGTLSRMDRAQAVLEGFIQQEALHA